MDQLQPIEPSTGCHGYSTAQPEESTAKPIARLLSTVSRIANLALEILLEDLQGFGNTLTPQQKEGLRQFLWLLAAKAFKPSGATVYPLPCGTGKTQSVVALCTALTRLGIDNISMVIAAFKVEALCEIKRHLIRNGVPASAIGLRHRYKYDVAQAEQYLGCGVPLQENYASEAATMENGQRQFLLATQVRAKSVENGELDYKGASRQLLIWDESLLCSTPFSIERRELKSSIGYIAPYIGEAAEVTDYLYRIQETLEAEIVLQKAGHRPQLVNLPTLPPEHVEAFQHQLKNELHTERLSDLLATSQSPLRVAVVGNEAGLIGYRPGLTVDIPSIAVLDASHPIRELVQMDTRMYAAALAIGKRYDRVVIHHMNLSSGRRTVSKDFMNRRREDRTLSLEICAQITSRIPVNEGVILFTFKQQPGRTNIQEVLQADIRHHCVDLDATIKVRVQQGGRLVEQERPRFVWLTWGQETSQSAYAYCSHVIFVGVLHRSHIDLAAAIAGQKRDLLTDLSKTILRQVMTSETAHCVYQGMHRGACRISEGDLAHEMHAWLIHHCEKDFINRIDKVMPGVKWECWTQEFPNTLLGRTAAKIKAFLDKWPEDSISVQALKKGAGLTSVNAKTFTRSLDQVLTEPGWEKHKRTLVRVRHGTDQKS